MAQTFFFPFLAFAAQVAYGIIAAVGYRTYRHFHPEIDQPEFDQPAGVETISKGIENKGVANEAYQMEA